MEQFPFNLDPGSISCLENQICKRFKAVTREKAHEHNLGGLPLGVGVGLGIIFEEVLPSFSKNLQHLPQEPQVPPIRKTQAKQMYAYSKEDVSMYDEKYVCIQRDDEAVLEKATDHQYREALKLMQGVTTRDEFRALTRIRIFTEKECLICPWYLNKSTCPHILLAQLMNHKDIDKQGVLPTNRKKGRRRKRRYRSYKERHVAQRAKERRRANKDMAAAGISSASQSESESGG